MAHAYLKGPFQHRTERYCSKAPFETRRDALAHLRKWGIKEPPRDLIESSHGELQVYKCLRCNYFHLGHAIPR